MSAAPPTASTQLEPAEEEYRRRLQRALGDGYELRDLIGRGGFGAVYVAWDRKLERDVAVKALRHDLFPTRELLDRFQREARAVAKLRHAHILPVYSVGEGEGLAFMIMPVIHGANLKAMMQEGGRLKVAGAVRITSEVARALEAAHKLGIVHRDVKPENILIEGDDRHALLADFGIAKLTHGAGGALTASGMIIGSPQYMSPEQAAAEADLDARTDVYSLGAVLYELLAGRRPYEAASFQQLLVQQITTEPPDVATLVPDLPPALASTVMKAIARDRNSRWASAGEFAAALTAAMAPGPEKPVGDSWFAKRGLLIATILVLWYYLAVTAWVVIRAAGNAPKVVFAVTMFSNPMAWVFGIALIAFLIELLFLANATWMSSRSWGVTARGLFGQPRWWQAWYPRALRDPDSAWDRMPVLVKILRTLAVLFLLMIPLGLPQLFVVPTLVMLARGAGMALPLPLRFTIVISSVFSDLILLLFAVMLGGSLWLARRRGVRLAEILRLLFTWRASAWDTASGRRVGQRY